MKGYYYLENNVWIDKEYYMELKSYCIIKEVIREEIKCLLNFWKFLIIIYLVDV